MTPELETLKQAWKAADAVLQAATAQSALASRDVVLARAAEKEAVDALNAGIERWMAS